MRGNKPRVLLVEDNKSLREVYQVSLRDYGFDVHAIFSERELEEILKKEKFNIVLSDTDLDKYGGGPEAVKRSLDQGHLGEDVLIIGMSDDSDNQVFWRGLSHIGCFYDKDYFEAIKIGEIVMNCWNNFKNYNCWRRRMPEIRNR